MTVVTAETISDRSFLPWFKNSQEAPRIDEETREYSLRGRDFKITITSGPGSGFNPTLLERLSAIMGLQRGWDGGRAAPPNAICLVNLISLFGRTMLPGTPLPSIVPLRSGGLLAEWHAHQLDIELEASRSGKPYLYVRDLSSGDEIERELDSDLAALERAMRILTMRANAATASR